MIWAKLIFHKCPFCFNFDSVDLLSGLYHSCVTLGVCSTHGTNILLNLKICNCCVNVLSWSHITKLYPSTTTGALSGESSLAFVHSTGHVLLILSVRLTSTWVSTWAWWRHQMEAFSALLALCAGNSPVPGEFPSQRPVTRSFDIFLWSAHK